MKFVKNSPFNVIPTFSESEQVNCYIEIPAGSRFKYEYNEASGVFEAKRILPFSWTFPVAYGCIPRTLAEDGDCLDALVFFYEQDKAIERGTVTDGRVVGALKVIDRGELDYKVLIIPSMYPEVDGMNALSDFSNTYLLEISHFFENYKTGYSEAPVVGPWISRPEAVQILSQSIENHKKAEERFLISTNY